MPYSKVFYAYKLKAKLIKLGLTDLVKKFDKSEYIRYSEGIVDEIIDNEFINAVQTYGYKAILESRKINNATYSRVKRLKRRIARLLSCGKCIFATLTFNDDTMSKTDVDTRRKYVTRYLKSISNHYVANIDYGVDDLYTHREHYHALIFIDFVESKWEYGYSWYERVHNSNSRGIACYISKLTNHAIKDSTRRNHIIYSRS